MTLTQVSPDAGLVTRAAEHMDGSGSSSAPTRRPALAVAVGLLALAAGTTAAVQPGRDTVAEGWAHSTTAAASLTWLPLLALLLCSALHYLAAAGALRAACTAALPVGETTAACLSAGAANKITPAGLGGSALLARYLVRRTSLRTPEAVGTVGLVALGRALAAALMLTALAAAGPLVGVDGGRTEVVALGRRLTSPAALPWAAGVAGVFVLAGAALVVRGRAAPAGGAGRRLAGVGAPLRAALRSPRRAGALLACSGAQSVLLGLAFAASSIVLPGTASAASLAALVTGYLLAAAVAAAVPTPGGVGSTEAALTAVLVAAQVPVAHALVDVALFRVFTLWVPAGAGLLCAPVLRRRGAL